MVVILSKHIQLFIHSFFIIDFCYWLIYNQCNNHIKAASLTSGKEWSYMSNIVNNAEIIRSRRKTVSLQKAEDGHLIVRAPLRCTNKEIIVFIEKSEKWIKNHIEKVNQINRQLKQLEPFTEQHIREMAMKANKVIPERVKYWAEEIGVTYGSITIRKLRSKWGSCTSKGNLSFNCLLMAAPPDVLDSIIIHELCHRKHMDHSKKFYAEIYRVFPDYDRCSQWLKDNGSLLIKRMIAGARNQSN